MSALLEEIEVFLEHATSLEQKLQGSAPLDSTRFSEQLAADFAANVRNRIRAGISRQDDSFLETFFQEKTGNSGNLSKQQFNSALVELGIRLKEDEIDVIFRTVDVNKDGVMDLEEFKKAVRFPTPIQQLISTLPITQIFADAMPDMMGNECLRQFGQVTPEQIEDICKEALPFLKTILTDAVTKVRVSLETMDKVEASRGASKFEVPPEMSAGSVEDFHGGLTGRIGK